VTVEKRRHGWGQWITATLSVVALAAAAEGWVGWFAPSSYDTVARGAPGYTYMPGLRSVYRNVESGLLLPFEINSLGFRAREPQPGGQGRKVVVTGNSFVDAAQVPLTQRFTHLAETALAGQSQVLNLGINGQMIVNHMDVAQWSDSTLRPDLVAFFVTVAADFAATEQTTFRNGKRVDYAADAAGATRRETVLERTEQWKREVLGSLRRLWLVRICQQLIRQIGGWANQEGRESLPDSAQCPAALAPPPPKGGAPFHLTSLIIRDLHARLGDRLVVVLLPDETELAPPPGLDCDWNRADRWLADLSRDGGIATLSLKPVLAGHGPVFFPRGHLNPKGHILVGDALAGIVRSRLAATR
jgi:hypothetical protein